MIVSDIVQPGDVTDTVDLLTNIFAEAPQSFRPPLQYLLLKLQEIDDGAQAGDGRTIDTADMELNANRLVDLCKSAELPGPTLS